MEEDPTISIQNGKAIKYEERKFVRGVGMVDSSYGINTDGTYWQHHFSEGYLENMEQKPIAEAKLPDYVRKILDRDKTTLEEIFKQKVMFIDL